MNNILITGSSGFVGKSLVPKLRTSNKIIGIDKVASDSTDLISDIAEINLNHVFINEQFSIIHLAAAKDDFKIPPEHYFINNVTSTCKFLKKLDPKRILYFLHYSSVAAFDGKSIQFSRGLNCDDAYRVTKFKQDLLVTEWCETNNIPYSIVHPSAIFDRMDNFNSNIGRLRIYSKFIPFIPRIDVLKSLTYLPILVDFTEYLVAKKRTGAFLVINKPVLSVTEIISCAVDSKKLILKIPFLKYLLFLSSYILIFITLGFVDVKLTPNRIKKLFKDTSYLDYCEVDNTSYGEFNSVNLKSLLN